MRIVPVLLLSNERLVKTINFRRRNYIGDPLNTIRIFNELYVDEMIILDIEATKTVGYPRTSYLQSIASEAFFPLAYGGGISNVNQAVEIIKAGFERIIINSSLYSDPGILSELVTELGSSSIIASIDYIERGNERIVYNYADAKTIGSSVYSWASRLQDLGVGEIFLNSVSRDGTFNGYDTELIESLHNDLSIPLIACGGCSSFDEFKTLEAIGVSAAAGGSVFVYKGAQKAVLIQYPQRF